VADLVTIHPSLRYIRLNKRFTVGAKRNLACEHAGGEVLAHWDDDDWHAPHRLRYQVDALQTVGGKLWGINTLLFWDIAGERGWKYQYPQQHRFWLSGSTLCYLRDFWKSYRFADINVGEDSRFVWHAERREVVILPEFTFHVGIIHQTNVSPKNTKGTYWEPYDLRAVQQIIGGDWLLYRQHQPLSMDPVAAPISATERKVPMFTAARREDLTLPEYAALSHGINIPWMRRWKMPFALFQSRLSNTMAVLDCTINPANFQARLSRLYPHVLYRHWNPIQNGQSVLPIGVPDESFDRVICVNTLEHLLRPQRDALVAAMARKLKRGGWLVLTSDYLF